MRDKKHNCYNCFIAIALAVVLSVSMSLLLSGCGREKETSGAETVVFACINPNLHLQAHVREFNESQSKYQVEIKDYGKYENPQERLDLDIMAGEIPDILDMGKLDFDKYIAKGLLCDLYEYMDEDGEIDREDFIENILKAMEVDGKLYYMTSFFCVYGLMGRSEDCGRPLTVERLKQLEEQYGEGIKALGRCSNTSMLTILMEEDYKNFIDWDAGECHFDSGAFREILEYAGTYPDLQTVLESDSSDVKDMREHKILFHNLGIGEDFSNLVFQKYIFDAEVGFCGYPSQNGTGAAAGCSYIDFAAGITAMSEHKEGAWAFLRTLLTEEYAVKEMEGDYRYSPLGYPLQKDAFEAMVKKYTATESYTDAFGHTIYPIDGSLGTEGGITMETNPLTEEEIKYVRDMVAAVDHIKGNYSPAIMDIIEEEAQSYFDGRQDIDKTIENIQSRASIYVSEQK